MTNSNTDQGREDLILYCGKCMQEAMERGDKAMAQFWLGAQYEQIRLRSPQKVAEMEAERGLV